MRPMPILVVLAVVAAGIVRIATAAPPEASYHITLSKRALAAGETVELKLVPPPPRDVRVNYFVRVGTQGVGFVEGGYRAPYVILPGTPPAQVSASFSAGGLRVSASEEVQLIPGSVPGTDDCLGPGQSFSTIAADIEPSFMQVDELPELIQSVEPEYPRSAFVRGIEDTILVQVLVCRSGRVLDAHAVPRLRRGDPSPIESDPKLVEAALAAARQYIFKPALVAGQAVAVRVATPIRFRL